MSGFNIYVHHFKLYKKVNSTKYSSLWIWYVIPFTCLFFLSTVSYGFQCTNLSLPKEPFMLPCLSHLSQGQEDGLMKRGNVLPPLCTCPLVTCSTGVQGHALHLCLQVSLWLGIFFESECSPYYWNIHKHSPNAWPVSKSLRYTYIWISISDHQVFCNKEKPKNSSVPFPYLWSS